MQIEQGAVGVCAAKLSEAAVMLAAGVKSILLTSPLATLQKAQGLNALLQQHPDHNCTWLLILKREWMSFVNQLMQTSNWAYW